MGEEIKSPEKDMELKPDDLDAVSGGVMSLKELYNYLDRMGELAKIKNVLLTEGKKAAINYGCRYLEEKGYLDECDKMTSIIGMIK